MLYQSSNRRERSHRSAKRTVLGFESLETRAVLSATLIVPTDFTSIQAAVNAASEGDKIRVLPGDYSESVTINKNNLEIKASQKLATKVTPAEGGGFIFFVDGAKNVKIEGFEVSGPFTVTEFAGIQISNGGSAKIKDNLITKIRNEPLSGNQEGIGILVVQPNVPGTSSAEIEDNVISDYQKGGIVVGVGLGTTNVEDLVDGAKAYAEIEDNIITGVGPTGVIGQNGIQISNGGSAEIEENEISGNFFSNPLIAGTAGILVTDFAGPTEISKNKVYDNQIGIWVIDTTDVEVEKNKVYNNSEGGIFVDTSSDVEVSKNDVFDNTYYGISLFGSTDVEISQNVVSGNGLNGISLFGSSLISVFNNDVFDNGFFAASNDEGAGILLDESSDNCITNNKVSGNNRDGIALVNSSTSNLISNNKVRGNGGRGIFLDLDSVDNFIVSNDFRNNAGGASLDVSGTNRFSKNRPR